MHSTVARPWGTSRTTGLALVALVHLAIVAGLVQGMKRPPPDPPKPPVELRVLPPDTTPPVPPPVLQPQPPQPAQLTPLLVPVPEVPVVSPVPPVIVAQPATAAPVEASTATASALAGVPSGAPAGSGTAASNEVTHPGAACTAMPAPELPAVNWAGEATFRVLAEVQSGRVSSLQFLSARGAGLDARTRRALQGAIDATLRQGYVCPGHHRFEQEFHFRID